MVDGIADEGISPGIALLEGFWPALDVGGAVGHQLATSSIRVQPEWIHTGCIAVPFLAGMAKTLTLKNLPDALHARLTAAAKRHRRSLNNEAIVCLEAGLGSASPSADDELARIRALRSSLGPQTFDPDAIDAFKREGRP